MAAAIRRGRWLMAGAALAALGAAAALAQEHPEHPKAKPAPKEAVSKEEIGSAIRDWVARDTKLKGGFFLVWDGSQKMPLALSLSKVHDDKLAMVAKDTFFACADFKANDETGTVYDLDVFLKGSSAKDLTPVEVSIHKQSGKERYGWKEEGGTWKKVTK